jgi:RNA-directed DNA polymerase
MLLYSLHAKYNEFKIPKGNGKFRLIENPVYELKQIQKTLNKFFQALYYLKQTKYAYGFIISVKNGKDKKNILQNAKKHLGNKYMLKVDLKDFFHQVSKQRIYNLLLSNLFNFNKKTAQILSNIFTYKARLPMGAPTSPVLSNFVSISLDNALGLWANMQGITYTRFADDMTFSSNTDKFHQTHLEQIANICKQNNYRLNTKKTKFFDAHQTKKVTGLVLHDTVDIEEAFYSELEHDLKRLKYLIEATIIVQEDFQNPILTKMKQEVKGKINFIGMIEGYQSVQYNTYSNMLYDALHPKEEQLFIRWQHFNYL